MIIGLVEIYTNLHTHGLFGFVTPCQWVELAFTNGICQSWFLIWLGCTILDIQSYLLSMQTRSQKHPQIGSHKWHFPLLILPLLVKLFIWCAICLKCCIKIISNWTTKQCLWPLKNLPHTILYSEFPKFPCDTSHLIACVVMSWMSRVVCRVSPEQASILGCHVTQIPQYWKYYYSQKREGI